MKNRKNYLKSRKTMFIWNQIGMFSDRPCPICGEKGMIQIYKHDAWACIYCNEWLEKKCSSECDCPYCANRPDTPYEVFWIERAKPADSLILKNGDKIIILISKNGRKKRID